jgi:hypothetical protein
METKHTVWKLSRARHSQGHRARCISNSTTVKRRGPQPLRAFVAFSFIFYLLVVSVFDYVRLQTVSMINVKGDGTLFSPAKVGVFIEVHHSVLIHHESPKLVMVNEMQ